MPRRELTLGIGTTFDYSIPLPVMLELVARAGFSSITIGAGNIPHSGYDTPEGRVRVRELAAANHLTVHSVHAPFGEMCDISAPEEKPEPPTESPPVQAPEAAAAEAAPVGATTPPPAAKEPSRRELAVARVKMAVDAAAAIGSGIVILHPTARFPPEETRRRIHAVKESLKQLLPYARERNVRFAVENLPSLLSMQIFEVALEEFPELGVCYDSSHAQMSGNTFGVLQRFRDRVIALHISDNRGTNDDHMLPFEGIVEWEEFSYLLQHLPQIDTLMLEVEVRESAFRDTQEFLSQAAARARRLIV